MYYIYIYNHIYISAIKSCISLHITRCSPFRHTIQHFNMFPSVKATSRNENIGVEPQEHKCFVCVLCLFFVIIEGHFSDFIC